MDPVRLWGLCPEVGAWQEIGDLLGDLAERLTEQRDDAERRANEQSVDAEYYRGKLATANEKRREVEASLSAALREWADNQGEDGLDSRVEKADADEVLAAVVAVLEGGDVSDVSEHLPSLSWTVRLSLRVTADVTVEEASDRETAEAEAIDRVQSLTICRHGMTFELEDTEVDEVEAV